MRSAETIVKKTKKHELLSKFAATLTGTEHEQFEELLLALLSSSLSVFYIVQDKKFQVVTEQLLRQMNLSREELLERDPLSIVHPDDRAMVRENAVKMLKGERSKPYEFRILDKSGNVHYVMEAVTSITYRGKPAALGNWIDLTERRRTAEELRTSEERYRHLFNNLNDAAFLADAETGIIIETTQQGATLLGRSRSEIIGMHQSQLHPPDRADDYRQSFGKHIREGHAADYDGEIIRKDGTIVPVRISASTLTIGRQYLILSLFHDITERKQMTEALRESEEKFRIIFDNAADGILVAELEAKKFYIGNKAVCRMLGYSREEIRNLGIADIHPAKDLPYVLEQFEKQSKGEIITAENIPVKRKDGSVFYAEINSSPLVAAGGTYVIGIFRDITERKRAEAELRQSEKRYRLLAENLTDVIWTTDINNPSRLTYISPSVTRLLGFTVEEAMAREIEKVFTPASLETIRKAVAEDLPVVARETDDLFRSKTMVLDMYRKDGSIVPVEVKDSLMKEADGRPVEMLVIACDITERKQMEETLRRSEEKFSEAFQSNPNPCSITSLKDGKFLEINDSFSRITGYTTEEVIGNTAREINLWADERDGNRIPPLLRKHGRVTGEDITFRTKTGEIRRGIYSAEIVKLCGNDCVLSTINDITERKKMEEELRTHKDHLEEMVQERTTELGSLNKQLEQELAERQRIEDDLRIAVYNADAANQAKSGFLARMSHEIRTPIHGVMGTLDLLRDTELGQEQRQFVNMAKTSAGTLLNVINDILDFSKIEAGKMQMEDKDFNLLTVLEETLATMAVPAHKKGLEVLLQVSHGVPMALIGDAGRLRQVLVNLLGNAVKFTEQGEIALRADVEGDGEKEVELHFSVRDTGIGIPKEKQELLFHPFEQVDGSMNRKYGGSGLGLSICQQLVNMMNGRIWFTSWPGEGCIFHFTAKFSKQASGERTGSLTDIPSDLRGMPLLLIDDNVTCRSILRDWLKEWGFRVTDVDSDHAALKELEDARGTSQQFRLILLDKTMPAMNGGTVAEQILRNPALRPNVVMMLPANNISDDFAWCQELGISYYLVKPVKESELLNIILTTLGHAKTAKVVSQQAIPVHPGTDVPHLRILVAEDNATSQLIAKKMLERVGHAVQIAGNGEEAIRMVKEGAFDLVLMDVEMPEMNGLEATQFIRKTEQKSGQHIPIIAMTAYAMKEDRQRCLQAGMDAYLSKPVNPDELHSLVRSFSLGKDAGSEVLDIKAALKLVGGDEDLLKEVMGVFLEQDYPEQLKQLKDGVNQHDAQTVKAAAHSIKGVARSFGRAALSRTALRLEEMGRNNDLTGAEAALQELEQEVKQFADFFAQYSRQKRDQ